jgi:hypothetical protein
MRLVEDDYTGPRAARLGCPAPDVLFALNGDALPDDIRHAAASHVARCAACRALIADLDAIEIDVPVGLDGRVLGRRSTARTAWWKGALLPLAAVLVAAVGLGVWLRTAAPEVDRTAQGGASKAPADQVPAVKAGQWAVKKPALLLPLATAIVVRGEEAATGHALAEALAPYRRDDYRAAERLLNDVVARYPMSADGWFYLGATRLLHGNAAGAREALDQARVLGVTDRQDELEWLLATAEARTGAVDQARGRLVALCDGRGAFKAPACDARASLKAE